MRTAKIALVLPPDKPQWIEETRAVVREWNQTELAVKPFRIELIIYDEGEGPAVARRILVDPEVRGVVISGASPLLGALQGTRVAVGTSGEGDVRQITRGLLAEVAKGP